MAPATVKLSVIVLVSIMQDACVISIFGLSLTCTQATVNSVVW